MNQAIQESKSLWRIKNHYQQESIGSEDISTLWRKMEKEKEENIASLQALIAKYTNLK